MSNNSRNTVAILLFAVGVSIISFLYGAAAIEFKLFPHTFLDHAVKAGTSWYYAKIKKDSLIRYSKSGKSGVTIHKNDKAFSGVTLMSAYKGEGVFGAYLIDMDGRVLHKWNIPYSRVWPDAPHILHHATDLEIRWHGMHLYPNGDIVFNFQGGNFPFGGGLVKIDSQSNLIWKLARNTHHDLDVTSDGTIYAIAHNYKASWDTGYKTINSHAYVDAVLKVSPAGELIEEFSVIDAIRNSPFKGLLSLTYKGDLAIDGSTDDPLHLNNIDILSAEMAEHFPLFEQGDMLLSLREINTIAVIDGTNKTVKWATTGLSVRQHDPDFLENGNLLLFDNRGDNRTPEGSQILELSPATQRIVWRYTGTKEHPLHSKIIGNQQHLPNGNILITESTHGRIFEITRDGEIVWEYFNTLPEKKHKVGVIMESFRYNKENLTFLNTR